MMDLTREQIEQHARNAAIQSCVLLVSAKFGAGAGEWLLAQLYPIHCIAPYRAHCPAGCCEPSEGR